MKITNSTAKTIVLINGVQIKPKETINIKLEKGTALNDQVNGLIKKGILDN